jgi:hypothetical protein
LVCWQHCMSCAEMASAAGVWLAALGYPEVAQKGSLRCGCVSDGWLRTADNTGWTMMRQARPSGQVIGVIHAA